MFDPGKCDPQLLGIVDRVSVRLLAQTDHLLSADLMVLGAHCRNLHHDALGHRFMLRATEDWTLRSRSRAGRHTPKPLMASRSLAALESGTTLAAPLRISFRSET
jgi:hypothetical protein